MQRSFFRNRWAFCNAIPRSTQCLFKLKRWDRSYMTDIPMGPSRSRLDSLFQRRTTALFPFFLSSQPSKWGLLTQRNLRPWWIAALQTTTKSGLCWSVVTLHSRQRDQPVRACLVENSVCTVCCLYGSVCCPVYDSLCTPQVWCQVISQDVSLEAVFTEWLTG